MVRVSQLKQIPYRVEEIIKNANMMQNIHIEIDASVDEIATITYEVEEVVPVDGKRYNPVTVDRDVQNLEEE